MASTVAERAAARAQRQAARDAKRAKGLARSNRKFAEAQARHDAAMARANKKFADALDNVNSYFDGRRKRAQADLEQKNASAEAQAKQVEAETEKIVRAKEEAAAKAAPEEKAQKEAEAAAANDDAAAKQTEAQDNAEADIDQNTKENLGSSPENINDDGTLIDPSKDDPNATQNQIDEAQKDAEEKAVDEAPSDPDDPSKKDLDDTTQDKLDDAKKKADRAIDRIGSWVDIGAADAISAVYLNVKYDGTGAEIANVSTSPIAPDGAEWETRKRKESYLVGTIANSAVSKQVMAGTFEVDARRSPTDDKSIDRVPPDTDPDKEEVLEIKGWQKQDKVSGATVASTLVDGGTYVNYQVVAREKKDGELVYIDIGKIGGGGGDSSEDPSEDPPEPPATESEPVVTEVRWNTEDGKHQLEYDAGTINLRTGAITPDGQSPHVIVTADPCDCGGGSGGEGYDGKIRYVAAVKYDLSSHKLKQQIIELDFATGQKTIISDPDVKDDAYREDGPWVDVDNGQAVPHSQTVS